MLTITDINNCNETDNIPTQIKYTASKKNTKGNYNQDLSVTWISETVVQYTLIFDNQFCKKTIKGTAKSVKLKKAPSRSAYKGESFEVTQYVDGSRKGFKILLQIETTNKDKARATLTWNEEPSPKQENCKPGNVLMIAQN